MEFGLGVFVGALLASAGWWIKVRSISGVLSDAKDARDELNKLRG